MKNMIKPRKILLQLIDISTIFIINIILLLVGRKFIKLSTIHISILYNSIMILLMFTFRTLMGVYRCSWRYASFQEYFYLILSDIIGGGMFLLGEYLYNSDLELLIYNAYILTLVMIACVFLRLIYQIYVQYKTKALYQIKKEKIPIAIVGGGLNGALLAQALKNSMTSEYIPYCFIDNRKGKIGGYIQGIKVYEENENIIDFLKSSPVKEIIITVHTMTQEQHDRLFDLYLKTGLPLRIFDYPQNTEEINIKNQIRNIKIEDLLFREPINFDDKNLYSYYSEKVILITGGGGSIGSELCTQIAKLKPKKLIIIDIYENNAYDIQQCLIEKYKDTLDLEVEIASVRDFNKINSIFEKYKPHIVFHAAAHKHVPLMENSCDEAIKNNVFGTYNVVNIAEKFGVEKFIAISTDKAVNPTNIMGATKRLCEMIIRSKKNSKTDFMAVRFGNVLGSNGSVIPLFKNQIEKGGPLTLTDKRIIRYFMTIAEAVHLVMQAGVCAAKSEIFVLDMGKPVKILNLAENLISLSGLRPYKDIDIIEIGLRPGEKLYEELLIKTDALRRTENKKIFIEQDEFITEDEIADKLHELEDVIKTYNNESIKNIMKKVVPTFVDPEEVNQQVELFSETANDSEEKENIPSIDILPAHKRKEKFQWI